MPPWHNLEVALQREDLTRRPLFDVKCHRGTTWYCARLLIWFPQGYPGSNPGGGVISELKPLQLSLLWI